MSESATGPEPITDADDGVIQVVFIPAIQPALREWLASRGLYLFRIPGLEDDDLPTYGIGIG